MREPTIIDFAQAKAQLISHQDNRPAPPDLNEEEQEAYDWLGIVPFSKAEASELFSCDADFLPTYDDFGDPSEFLLRFAVPAVPWITRSTGQMLTAYMDDRQFKPLKGLKIDEGYIAVKWSRGSWVYDLIHADFQVVKPDDFWTDMVIYGRLA